MRTVFTIFHNHGNNFHAAFTNNRRCALDGWEALIFGNLPNVALLFICFFEMHEPAIRADANEQNGTLVFWN